MAHSHNAGIPGEQAALDASSNGTFVILSDWRASVLWRSHAESPLQVGELAWRHLDAPSQEEAKQVFSRVVALRETASLEVTNERGNRFRIWMWPLESPDIAVCVLGMEIPAQLGTLTKREKECLELLACGTSTNDIARKLDMSLSTVHTHLKRSREKLELDGIEALISFAARYCYPAEQMLARE
jgi:DNA-binding CsgD family transcriptional regulator